MSGAEAPNKRYMVLSSRDRRYVTVEMVWLGPSLERRRLRFSFQFNDVKDRDRLSPAPLFSAGGRRRRLSSGRPPSCQSFLAAFCVLFEDPVKDLNSERKNHSGAAEVLPSLVRSDSIEAGDLIDLRAKIKEFFNSCEVRCDRRSRARGAYMRGSRRAQPL